MPGRLYSPRCPAGDEASFGPPPRSKRRQRCTCSWTTLTALTPRKRRNPEDLRRVSFLIHLPSGQRYGCNWPVQWCRAVAIFPARASRQVRFPLAETRTRGKTLPVRTYDSLIWQRPPWMYLSELGWEISVDFKADAHFDESRSCPRHGVLSPWLWGTIPPFLKCPSAVSCKMALCLRKFGKIARRQLSVSP